MTPDGGAAGGGLASGEACQGPLSPPRLERSFYSIHPITLGRASPSPHSEPSRPPCCPQIMA